MSRDPKQQQQQQQQQQEEDDPLKKQFQTLVQDWNTYLQSAPRHRRSRSADNGLLHEEDEILGLGLLDNSPKKLLSSLQQCRSPRSVERRAAARGRGRVVKGRRSLLEELERVKDKDVEGYASPACSSVCSSVLIQEEEGSCSWSSFQGSDSTSLSTSLCRGEKGRDKEERWVVPRVIWVLVAVWVAAMGLLLTMVGFGGEDEYGEFISPT